MPKKTPSTHLKRLFIANRGEVCRRIAYSASRLGIETACLTDQVIPPLFLKGLITHFIQVPEENLSLHLNGPELIRLALAAGCDAVHPGFGFLSENAGFAQQVMDAGMTWVGPSSRSIELMADKSKVKEMVLKLGLPCIPSFTLPDTASNLTSPEMLQALQKIGYPLLVKAALGGGGKGIRIVYKPEELEQALSSARFEAKNAFGDASLLVERYIAQGRHVEVQLLGDSHGHIAVVGDRDCSTQRNHQKVIEEAPAPDLPPALRQAIHKAAHDLGQAVQYQSCGTCEFFVDISRATPEFFFLEMNTRLQVEHPVTEQIFGVDLVACQLRIAQGSDLESLAIPQQPRGHSIEARLYAEAPELGFLPSPGEVQGFVPFHAPNVRWEIGIDPIDVITDRFDPMIAKIISFGATRREAFATLHHAIANTMIVGPKTNRELLLAFMEDEEYLTSPQPTNFIPRFMKKWQPQSKKHLTVDWNVCYKAVLARQSQQAAYANPTSESIRQHAFAQESQEARVLHTEALFSQRFPRRPILHGRLEIAQHTLAFLGAMDLQNGVHFLLPDGHIHHHKPHTLTMGQSEDSSEKKLKLTSPVPGTVIKVLAKKGDQVQAGATLMVLESMKMEFTIKAQFAATLREVHVSEKHKVQAGTLLISLDPCSLPASL